MTSASPDLARPVFLVKASSRTTCPICGQTLSAALKDNDTVEWRGPGCPHLRQFDFHRIGQGPLMAVFVE